MAGFYRPRHPERTVLYRVLFHHFDRFLTEYESRFEREYGFFRPIVKEVVERYLDCGNKTLKFESVGAADGRGGAEAHPFQGLGGDDPEGLRGRPDALSQVRGDIEGRRLYHGISGC